MKINICTIKLNEEEGRQTIYLDTEDSLLHTDYDGSECCGQECATKEAAQDLAYQLWARSAEWDFDWIEE